MTTLLSRRWIDHGSSGPRRSSRRAVGLDLLAAGLAGSLVLAAVLVGQALQNDGVTLFAAVAPLFATWGPHFGPGTLPAVIVALLVVTRGPELAHRLGWRRLLAVGYLTSVAWTISLALIDTWQLGIAGRLTSKTEYLHEVPGVSDIGAMLAGFADRILAFQADSWTTHVAAHPPGALLLFVWLDRIGLSGGGPAGMLCILVGASACVAVAVTLRALGAESVARAALPFGVLLPGAVWIGVSADGLFAGVLAWGVALLAMGAVRAGASDYLVAGGGGLLLGASLYLSYGLALAGLLPVAVLLVARRVRPLLAAGVGVAAVVGAFTAAGFWWLDGYRLVKILYYQPAQLGTERPYAYWVWGALAALAIALGPATVAGLRRLFAAPRAAPRALLLLVGAAAVAVLVADLSGLSKGEVERIWLPFQVWMVAAAGLLPRRHAGLWLAAQAVVALLVNHLLMTPW